MKLHYFSAMLVAAMAAIACQPQDKAFEPKLEVDGITLTGGGQLQLMLQAQACLSL